jgi:exo-beta-1,3-glucanase (GH17 family)
MRDPNGHDVFKSHSQGGGRMKGHPSVFSILLVLLLAVTFILSSSAVSEVGAAAPPGGVRLQGVDYGPFRDGQRPGGPCPTVTQMGEDMWLLTRMGNAIRTYGLADCNLGKNLLKAAGPAPIEIVLGLWLGPDPEANAKEIKALKKLKTKLTHVIAIAVGSETLLRGDLSMEALIDYIQQVREIVGDQGIPITTAEPWHIWLGLDGRYSNPAPLVSAVDVLFLNIHPYWEQIPIAAAVDYLLDRVDQVQQTHPSKSLVISETGWPTAGPPNGGAQPSLENQQAFLKAFLPRAKAEDLSFFYFEAFDEQWKSGSGVEQTWGFYRSDRTPKQETGTLLCCLE